jgi:hypothetical protein
MDITAGHDLVQLSDFCHNQLGLILVGSHGSLDLSSDPSPLASSSSSLESTTTFLSSSTSSSAAYLQPAHEHTQPLWGPPDPYLSAGKSIAPLTPPGPTSAGGVTAALDAAGTTSSSSSSSSSTVSPELAQQARLAAARGWDVLDAQHIKAGAALPGFAETGGILPRHVPNLPLEETPATFAAQIEWSAAFLRVVDRLPYAALLYALVEFLVLRPNVDLYKEDVEDDPGRALADSVKVTTVRLGAFAVVAILTLVVFGG